MGQLGNLIKHQLIDNLTSGRYILTSLVCIVLCVISIVFNVTRLPTPRKRIECGAWHLQTSTTTESDSEGNK